MRRIVLLLCLLLSVSLIVFGCGKSYSPSSATVTPSSVTFTGTVAASAADLAQIGVSALAVESQEQKAKRVSLLKSMGFDEESINALRLVPLAAADTTVTLYKVNSDGSKTAVTTGTYNSTTATYTVTDSAYSASNTYITSMTKANSTTGKEMVIEAVNNQAPSGASSATVSGLNCSPQTSLLVSLIIEKVVKELGVTSLDPVTINMIQSAVVARFNSLVNNEGLQISTVKTTAQTDNTALKNTAIQAFSDEVVKKVVQAIRFKAGLAKGATDAATAKKIIKEIFTYITGRPTGIPQTIVDSFATSYINGVTKKLSQVVPAANGALVPASTSTFTEDNLAAAIKALIDATYQSATSAGVGSKDSQFEVKSQNPLVQGVLPAATFYGKDIAWLKAHDWTVPEMLILMPAVESVANGTQINYPKFMVDLGLMTLTSTDYTIMHSEVRIESWEDWQHFTFDPLDPTARPTVNSVLTSFLNVENLANPNATGTITATLTYVKNSDGTSATASYEAQTQGFVSKSVKTAHLQPKAPTGPPPGSKMFQIAPWGDPSTAPAPITDFKLGSTATIKMYKDGTLLESKDVVLTSVDLSKSKIVWIVPAPDKFNQNDTGLTVLSATEKPTLSWTFSSSDNNTISFGSGSDALTPAYAVEVRATDAQGRADFSSSAVYSSWHKQDFPKGVQNETTVLRLPAALPAGTYSIMGAVVGLDAGGWPVTSGPWRSSIFVVGSATAIASKSAIAISGTVTPLTSPQGTIKVGIFKMGSTFGQSIATPVFGPGTLNGSNAYSITVDFTTLNTSGSGGYETIAWDDANADGNLDPGERPSFPSKHMGFFGGTLDCKDQNFSYVGIVSPTENNTGYDIDMTKYQY